MSHAVSSRYVTASTSPESGEASYRRPETQRENTSDILEYYNSADASVGYSAADFARSHAAQPEPPTAPASSIGNGRSQCPAKDKEQHPAQSSVGSIRLVPRNTNGEATDPKRRPSLHHVDSANMVMDNRRLAIVEWDASPSQGLPNLASPTSSTSPTSSGVSPSSVMQRRGVDRPHLALVAPPDASPASYTAQSVQSSPPSAATFALSKSSRSKYAEPRSSPIYPESHSIGNRHSSPSRSHARSSSEITPVPASTQNSSKHLFNTSGSSSAHGGHGSPRDVGASKTASRLAEHKSIDHNRHRPASNGSDHGDNPNHNQSATYSAAPHPNLSGKPHPPVPPSQPASVAENRNGGMHIPLPTRPRFFGSSPGTGTTPTVTPAIGDAKAIDLKVAAPVVVDIRSDLADLWLAANPDTDHANDSGSGVGSPMTATTTTTDLSSVPAGFSPRSSRQSSVTSPLQSNAHAPSREINVDPSSQPIPLKRIEQDALSSNSGPTCSPRPYRQPSPIKGGQVEDGHGYDRTSASTIKAEDTSSSKSSSRSRPRSKVAAESDLDSKYALASVSDSDSQYSVDEQRMGRLRPAAQPSSVEKNGPIHTREGAFPPHSVFIDRIRTELDPAPPDSDMKTPTSKHTIESMFPHTDNTPTPGVPRQDGENTAVLSSFDTQNTRSQLSGSQRSSSKLSHGRSSSELPPRRSRPGTTESLDSEEEHIILNRSSSVRPSVPPKEPEEILRRYAESGRRIGGAEPLSSQHDSATESSTSHRQYPHSHLGHGLPPISRHPHPNAPSSFKAKGPLNTSRPLRSARTKKASTKPRSMWPSSMSFADVLAEQTALARARGYAMKINELATEDCGLSDWIDSVFNRTRPTVDTPDGPVPVGPTHLRLASGSSAVSEATFPIRPDAHKAMDLTPVAGDLSTAEVPSTLPYPSLALRQQTTGSCLQHPPTPTSKSSIGSVVTAPVTFFTTLSRKASMRTRGTQSATEGRDREKEKESKAPRKLVRPPPSHAGGTPSLPSTPISSAPPLPTLGQPSLPGGPRAPRPKRSSTVMVSSSKPLISNPLPIAPPHSQPELTPTETMTDSSEMSASPSVPPLHLSKEPPRHPEGPRPPKLARTPSFPGHGSKFTSSSDNLRSAISFRPLAAPPATAPTRSGHGTRSDVGVGPRRQEQEISLQEFERQLDKLCDILPHVSRDTLTIYLQRANGQNMIAIGRYLEDERQGTVFKI